MPPNLSTEAQIVFQRYLSRYDPSVPPLDLDLRAKGEAELFAAGLIERFDEPHKNRFQLSAAGQAFLPRPER